MYRGKTRVFKQEKGTSDMKGTMKTTVIVMCNIPQCVISTVPKGECESVLRAIDYRSR